MPIAPVTSEWPSHPGEWWDLWERFRKPVERIYCSFPSIEGTCTIGEVIDYTTDELVNSSRTTEMDGNGIFRFARKVARNFCLRVKVKQLQNNGMGDAISDYYAQVLTDSSEFNLFELAEEDEITTTPEELLAIIKDLCSKEQYTILYLHYYKEISYVKIAEILQMKYNTVKGEARRALGKIFKHLTNKRPKK